MELADCRWLEAVSVEDALTVARMRLPDLVLMDIDLPKWNGVHAREQVKLIAVEVQVIVITIREAPQYRADFSLPAPATVWFGEMSRPS